MARRSICLIGKAGPRGPLDRWRNALASSWPAFAASPSVAETDLRAALRDADVCANASAALVIATGVDVSLVCDLVGRLQERLVPVVLITNTLDRRMAQMSTEGVVVAPDLADPASVCAMLHALAERQPAVEGLGEELALTERFQTGLCDEIDKIQEELHLAARVQQEMLPKSMPRCGGVEFGVFFRPCSYVSGDIYDVARLDERHVGFFVADAVGHGVPAALMTMMISRSLSMVERMEGPGRIVSPAVAMRRLNESMLLNGQVVHRFITAVYGVIDVVTRRVTLAGAGHPPPLVLRADGETDEVETAGALLGVFPEAEFDEATFTLGEGDMLLMYSDGFEMAFPREDAAADGRRLPTRRYMHHFSALAESRRERGLEAAIEALIESVDRQRGSLHQVDDMTALMVAAGAPVTDAQGAVAAPGSAVPAANG